MNTTIKHNNLTWINLLSPSAKEIHELAKEYPIHSLIAEELTSLTMRPKVDVYEENLYFVLHFQSLNQSHECELDFVIGKDFLITVQYDHFLPLEKFIKNAQNKEDFKEKLFESAKATTLSLNILKELYNFSSQQLDKIYIKTTKVEEGIFGGKEKENVKEISFLKRDILDFQRSFYLHGDVLSSFEQAFKDNNHDGFFEKEFGNKLSALIGEHSKIRALLQNSKETTETLHQTNESLLSTKTNEIMKTLTIMAFITFPLMLLSGVFGMNTVHTPIIGARGDFWIITVAMITATFGMFAIFKKKGWL
ncbi:magnesium transporter CorA family protein [Patescibacteria group bacterium]